MLFAMADRTEWTERVGAWRASGMTARAFCAERGIALSSLYLWASKLKREARQAHVDAVKLARVVRERPAPRDADIVIELGALRVRLPAKADVRQLELILSTLARVSP
jgi:hypothetical protein